MGIRIHKQLGWVIEWDSDYPEELFKLSFDDFFNKNYNLELEEKIFLNLNKEVLVSSPISSIVNIVKIKNKNWLIITPPEMSRDWIRHSDTIDFYESKYLVNKISFRHYHVFPYSEKIVVSKTLNELSSIQKELINYADKLLDYSKEKIGLEKIGINFKKKNIRKQIHMIPPVSVKLIWQLIDKKNQDYKTLKPALITFWE